MTVDTADRKNDRRLPMPAMSQGLYDAGCSVAEGAAVWLAGLVLLQALPALGLGQPLLDGRELAAPAASYVLLAWLLGLYPRRRLWSGPSGEIAAPRVLATVFLCFGVAAVAILREQAFAIAGQTAVWFVLALPAVKLVRLAGRALESRLVFRHVPPRRAVIVGAGAAAAKLMEDLRARRSAGAGDIEFLGFFDDRQTRAEGLERHLPYLGKLDALVEFVADHEDIDVFMALPWTAGGRIATLLERLRFLPITVWLLPDPELSALSLSHAGGFDGVVMPTLMTPPFSAVGRFAKTAFDVVAGSIILLLISPILLVTALAIKLDSPGPVLFRQQRSGQFGRKFSIYKFRSLHVARADAEAETLVSRGDSRVTRVGRIIRKYSIDELPQIFNVLRGEMSLVGPRPHAPKAKADGRLYADVMPDYAIRYRVKPGMTGWAQVNGWRGETDTEEKLLKRVEYDFDYIRHWSFQLDLVILLRTVPAVLLPKNNV